MKQRGGNEVGGFEDLQVALGVVVSFRAVDDGLGAGVPGDFLEGEGMTEEILGEAFAPGAVVGGDGFFAAVVDVEAGVFPGEEVGEFSGADELGVAQGVEEAMAEEFEGRGGGVPGAVPSDFPDSLIQVDASNRRNAVNSKAGQRGEGRMG